MRRGASDRPASSEANDAPVARSTVTKNAQTGQEQHKQHQTLGEKQAERVEALRSAQSSEAEMASARARIAADITVQLEVRVRGKTLQQALREFGVPVATDVPEADAVASAYRKALAKYHPDRAMQKRLSLKAQVEAEEIYKMIQNLHDTWAERAPQHPDNNGDPFTATAASRRSTPGHGTPSWSSAAGHSYGAGRRAGAGARTSGRPTSAGANPSNISGNWSAQAQQRKHQNQQVIFATCHANSQSAAPSSMLRNHTSSSFLSISSRSLLVLLQLLCLLTPLSNWTWRDQSLGPLWLIQQPKSWFVQRTGGRDPSFSWLASGRSDWRQ